MAHDPPVTAVSYALRGGTNRHMSVTAAPTTACMGNRRCKRYSGAAGANMGSVKHTRGEASFIQGPARAGPCPTAALWYVASVYAGTRGQRTGVWSASAQWIKRDTRGHEGI